MKSERDIGVWVRGIDGAGDDRSIGLLYPGCGGAWLKFCGILGVWERGIGAGPCFGSGGTGGTGGAGVPCRSSGLYADTAVLPDNEAASEYAEDSVIVRLNPGLSLNAPTSGKVGLRSGAAVPGREE